MAGIGIYLSARSNACSYTVFPVIDGQLLCCFSHRKRMLLIFPGFSTHPNGFAGPTGWLARGQFLGRGHVYPFCGTKGYDKDTKLRDAIGCETLGPLLMVVVGIALYTLHTLPT